jgi:hypothetical protein
MNTSALIRVARQQVKLATRGLDRDGLIALYLDEIPVEISRRVARRRFGFHHSRGVGDVGRIVVNLGMHATEAEFLNTLYHELAHAVAFWLHGREADSHGPKWKAIMVQLGQKPERCG